MRVDPWALLWWLGASIAMAENVEIEVDASAQVGGIMVPDRDGHQCTRFLLC